MSENRCKVHLIDGVFYDLWAPSGPVPAPATIAYGLAHLCRYGGHTKRFYSVAEHTIWCALRLATAGLKSEDFMSMADHLGDGHAPVTVFTSPWITPENVRLALLGLIHDAPEGCGLVDVPGPILRHEEMIPYKQAHVRCYDWLSKGWGIELPTISVHEVVKKVDTDILGAEMAIRPLGARDGNGENLPQWEGFNLASKHNLAQYGTRHVAEVWLAVFTVLKGRLS